MLPSKSIKETRITGNVTRVFFQNRETGWFVAEIREHEFKELLKVVGTTLVHLEVGYIVACTGAMANGDRGLQFESSLVEASPPRTISGIRRYLGSGIFHGIGQRTIDLIVDQFGANTIDVLDQNPELLTSVSKLLPSKRKILVAQWQSHQDLRDITLFAMSQGITQKQIKKIIKEYGENAVAIIKADPYCLYRDIDGIGFRTADAIARKLGVGLDSPIRIRAALRFTLEQAATEGHCGLFRPIAVSKCIEILKVDLPDGQSSTITVQAVVEAGRKAIENQEIVLDNTKNQQAIYLPWLHAAETGIASHLFRLLHAEPHDQLVGGQLAGLIERVSERSKIELGTQQRAAVEMVLLNKVSIITGGPGVGKTTIQKVLLAAFDERGWHCSLCAPTGKAANRMAENAGRLARTIHRLLAYRNGVFQHNEDNPISTAIVIADEFSMVDVQLGYALLRAIPTNGRLIMVGDVDQIESVGPGHVLYDLIASKKIPVTRLTQVYRQAAQSHIIQTAHGINRGVVPPLCAYPPKNPSIDLTLLEVKDNDQIAESTVAIVQDLIRLGISESKIQVLAPMKNGPAGIHVLNQHLSQLLKKPLPLSDDESYLASDEWPVSFRHFEIGDRVIQGRNDYVHGIYNGDIGTVVGVRMGIPTEQTEDGDPESVPSEDLIPLLDVQFQQGLVSLSHENISGLHHAYAITIHKSQGSEFDVLVLVICRSHYIMLKRNLIYTGITRGKKQVVIVGQTSALKTAAKNVTSSDRHTRLYELLTRSTPQDEYESNIS
jgi:exodeoxyribonuclease V alpha subunit